MNNPMFPSGATVPFVYEKEKMGPAEFREGFKYCGKDEKTVGEGIDVNKIGLR